jgi:Rha family phage regulatory protein
MLVAKKFNKQHKDVIRSIKSLINSAQNCAQLFVSASYVDEQGKERPMYIMNRDGFSLLVMGFTGKVALNFKLEFIEAFNQMEQRIKEILLSQANGGMVPILRPTPPATDATEKDREIAKWKSLFEEAMATVKSMHESNRLAQNSFNALYSMTMKGGAL